MSDQTRLRIANRTKPLHHLCSTFPSPPTPEILRDHIIETYQGVFSGPIDLLVIEGEDGGGKTTLLSQFARRYPTRAISSFVTSMPRHSYDATTLRRDYTAQLLSILDPRKSFTPEEERDGVLEHLIHNLKRRYGTDRYYFILDGITDIEDPTIMNEVASLLPIGSGFRTLVSGEARLLPPELRNSPRTTRTIAIRFSLTEVQQYLGDLELSDETIKGIYQECGKGVPANLASVRRNLLAGTNLDSLRQRSINDLFEQEWDRTASDDLSRRIVAVVAHSRHRLTLRSLADVLRVEDEAISTRLCQLRFLQTDPTTSYVSFVSRAFSEFAERKLADSKGTVIDMLVEYVLDRQDSEELQAVDSVPRYLQESGKLSEVISFLSPDYFSRVLRRNASLAPLRRQFEIGMDAATNLRQDGDLVRFGLESSMVREIAAAQVSRAEVEALVTLEQGTEALALARSCPLREDRLHLLAVVARSEKERGTPVAEEVLDQIRLLHGQIDTEALGDKAIDIAADLFPCCPDLAVRLIEESSSADADVDGNELDVAYVRLSIATALRQTVRQDDQDHLEKIRDRIKNPRLRGFAASLSDRVQSAAEVVAEVEGFESASDKLYFLRKWALEYSAREDAIDVAEYGLSALVQASAYAPNVRVLRELSTPLIHTKDTAMAQSLVSRFDGQRSTVDEQGPTEEVVRLHLNLAIAESLYDLEACANRLVEVYLVVDELTDLSTKSSCLARLLSALSAIESSECIEKKDNLGALSSQELERVISELLDSTAEQVGVTRRTIEAMASFDAPRAITLGERLNTAARREEALLAAVDAILENNPGIKVLNHIRTLYDRLGTVDARDSVATKVAEYLVRSASSNRRKVVDAGCQLFRELFLAVSDPTERCRILCLLDALRHKGVYNESPTARTTLQDSIDGALAQLEPGWPKIEAGFLIARSVADRHPSLARRHLQDAESERKRTAFSSLPSEWAYQASLRLAIRAFAGQLGHGYDPRPDLSRLQRLIDRLPSASRRAQLWGDLAMHLLLRKHSDDAKHIVQEHLIPLIDLMPPGPARASIIVAVSPALYQNHKTTTIQLVNTIEPHQRNLALMTCAEFILEKHVPSDPYESHDNGYELSHQDATDITELAKELSQDNLVYVLIVALADTLSSARWSRNFTPQQKSDLVGSIKEIARTKFPDPGNIQHDGYTIATDAQILRIERGPYNSWIKAVERARCIPNTADRAYVLAIIGQVTSNTSLRERLFNEAIDVTNTIPCTYDRLERLSHLADMMTRKSPRLARKCVSTAIRGTRGVEDGIDPRFFRNMVDTAFKVDEEYAASLVSLVDDDPARVMARHEISQRLDVLRAKKAIVDGAGTWDGPSLDCGQLARSAWLALGSLNAERVNTVAMDQLRPALRAAGGCALRYGYWILAWVIENSVRRFSGTSESRSTVRLIFDGAIRATELAEVAGASVSVTIRRGAPTIPTAPSENRILVKRGERDRAEEFLRKWLERSSSEYIYICDQYFGPDELDLLKLVQSVVPTIDIRVLTSRNYHRRRKITDLADAYRTEWQRISDQRPPRAEIVVIGLEKSGKSPIHDRSVLTERSGVDIGTSWNSLGLSQDSTISVLTQRAASELTDRVSEFLVERRREYATERLLYDSVTL